jgi:hypothetical protein
MMADERKTTLPLHNLEDMRGVLFKNLKKEKPTHSDYYGEIKVDGYAYWMNGWVHTDTNGNPYVALQFKAKPGQYDEDEEARSVSSKGKDFL